MELPRINAIEVRVLGSLIEKELTTPDYYPLSLNALVNACNQINNRQPVVAFGESDVTRALDTLRDKRLAVVIAGGDNRVMKFAHKTGDVLELGRPERALLCELLLRGLQTPGELRSRAGRMHAFADLADVQTRLGQLAARAPSLVAILPRQPGTKESRCAHLLAGPVETPAPAEPAAVTTLLSPDTERFQHLESEIAALKSELADLRRQFADFRKQFE